MLDMPCLTESSFQQQQRSVIDAVQTASSDILARAVSIVREVYCGLDPSLSDSDVIDIPVSYDGSWMTRGHTSNFGIGAVVDGLTGLVVDFAVMSRYCHGCQVTGSQLKGADYEAWKAAHQCDKNYTGSAGMMEVVAAEQIWKRSVATNKLRLLSDGDSKSFTNLNSLIANGDLYDSHHPIEKEECVNHVCKRLGRGKEGVTLGGRGWGKLTDAKIDVLQRYYTRAVRSHKSIDEMRNAIMATWFHCVSTDEEPHHLRCPKGTDSWCFYQRALTAGTEPGSHEEHVSTALDGAVAMDIVDIYPLPGDAHAEREREPALRHLDEVPEDSILWPAARRGWCCARHRRVQRGAVPDSGDDAREDGHQFGPLWQEAGGCRRRAT